MYKNHAPVALRYCTLYCGIPTVVRLPRRCCTDRAKPLQICFLSAATGKAFTTVFAGFAFTLVSLPKIILVHAFVAGLVLVLMRHRPGMVNTPVFLTSFVATVTRLFRMGFDETHYISHGRAVAIAEFLV